LADRSVALDLLCERVERTHHEVGGAWPYWADQARGRWRTCDDGDWCAGHWIEALRIVGERGGGRDLVAEAVRRTWSIEGKLERDDMFRAPKFYYSAARLAESEGIGEMAALAARAARAMRAMALPVNGAMPIGTEVQVLSTDVGAPNIVAVDNVHPNLLLDWWSARRGDGEEFVEGARRHLAVTARDFVREDGSTIEFIEYDPESGEPRRHFTLLGLSADSCWSRGQAWAVGGYLRAWEETRAQEHLDVASRLLDYFWARSNAQHIPPWDFDADPDEPGPVDTSAAAIVAAALARLAVLDPRPPEVAPLVERLEPLLAGLCAHLTPVSADDDRPVGMLLDGCFNRPRRFADRSELVWGDFYLLEALHCLDRGGLPC